jgi:hypothetical protein
LQRMTTPRQPVKNERSISQRATKGSENTHAGVT